MKTSTDLDKGLVLPEIPTMVAIAWAADCVERALPIFERKRPNESRWARKALSAVRDWAACPCEKHCAAVERKSLCAPREYRDDDDAPIRALHELLQAVSANEHNLWVSAQVVRALRAARSALVLVHGTREEEEWHWQLGQLAVLLGHDPAALSLEMVALFIENRDWIGTFNDLFIASSLL